MKGWILIENFFVESFQTRGINFGYSPTTISKKTGITYRRVLDLLKDMETLGVLRKVPHTSGGYRLNKDYFEKNYVLYQEVENAVKTH